MTKNIFFGRTTSSAKPFTTPVLVAALTFGIPNVSFSATEIGATGTFFTNLSDGTVRFYSDVGETNFLGEADPDDVTGVIRPCDADSGAEGLEDTNTLPIALGTASYEPNGAGTFPPSSTSGHCFYLLSNNEYVAIENMSDSGETSTIADQRIFHCPSSTVVTANNMNLRQFCVNNLPVTPVPTMSAWGLGILASLLGIISFRRRIK